MRQAIAIQEDEDWVEAQGKNEWKLVLFPFFLVIEYRPREEFQFVGSLKGALCNWRECKSWRSLPEAKAGMVEWAMDFTMETYHRLGAILQKNT